VTSQQEKLTQESIHSLDEAGNVDNQSQHQNDQNDQNSAVSMSLSVDNSSSLNVNVQLAGEVIGLKPPAVARSPKPPRVFILSRSGDAVEVVSFLLFSRIFDDFVCFS
jgi:hypothetical protein